MNHTSNPRTGIRQEAAYGLFLFLICFFLASLEVQIEGANGWAAALPTWRILDPRLTWIFGGRPVTGYHVFLDLLLLTFFHLPLVFTGFTWRREAVLLSGFGLIAVCWDFLWFVDNPSFGLHKYSGEFIWWFKHWRLGFPVDYYIGILVSFAINATPGLASWRSLRECALGWVMRFAVMVVLTGTIVLIHTFAL